MESRTGFLRGIGGGGARDNCFVEGLEGDQKTGRVIRGNVKRYVSLIDTSRQRKGGTDGGREEQRERRGEEF